MNSRPGPLIGPFILFCLLSAIPGRAGMYSYTEEQKELIDRVLEEEERHLAFYRFDPSSPVVDRIAEAPPSLLKVYEKWFQPEPYLPDEAEKERFTRCLELLPPLHRRIFRERLAAVYFVSNVPFSGFAEWIIGENGELYSFLFLNPAVMHNGLAEWLTIRERTAFSGSAADIRISVDCEEEHTGLLYILLHEGTHVVDYAMGLTPFVEIYTYIYNRRKGSTDFIRGIWKRYGKPFGKYDFPQRGSVGFYDPQGGKLDPGSSPGLYTALEQTPWVSLYACMSWAEDLAESLVFYHLTGKLGCSYSIDILEEGTVKQNFDPYEKELFRERTPFLEMFYEEQE